MNTNTLRAVALLIAFASGAFAHSFYFKTPKDMVQLQKTDSGLFVLNEGHIYNLDKLEMARASIEPSMPAYSDGSQSYHLPTGKK
jgi:hypothetical protein